MYPLSKDPEFAFILEEQLSLSNGGGANTGEVLRAAARIIPGSFESFYNEFFYLAEHIHAMAENAYHSGFLVSAREAYFRAATYYRAADFFLHGNWNDSRIYTLWDSATADFDRGISLLSVPGQRYNISGPGFSIPVIFYKANDCNDSLPTVLAGSGYDGSQEALYHAIGTRILERGYNFVTYEGPGQPTVRRQQNLGFIPNWWDAVTPVVDFLAARSDVDMNRLALEGLSFGGTLAPLAASREKRFAAVLAIDGLVNLGEYTISQFPSGLVELFNSGNKTAFDEIFDSLQSNASTSTELRWGIDQGEWSFDTHSAFDWITRLKAINLTQEAVDAIDCPIFIGKGQNDALTGPEPERMKALAGSKGYFHYFPTDLGEGEHCQIGAEGALAMASMDWLESVFQNGTKHNR